MSDMKRKVEQRQMRDDIYIKENQQRSDNLCVRDAQRDTQITECMKHTDIYINQRMTQTDD